MAGPELRVYTDGASRGNPGHGGFGVVILDAEGATREERQGYLGLCTNNVAEYRALLDALAALPRHAPARVIFHLDSELVVKQINGQYKVKDLKMQELHALVKKALLAVPAWTVKYVPREENRRADALANAAIDEALKSTA